MNNWKEIKTLGDLKKAGYKAKSIKDEIRHNLIDRIKKGDKSYKGIFGFDDTVIPDMERALLSRHNILLLGLRGQAKTRIARLTTELLDEYIPVVAGAELNDDHPLNPISKYAHDIIKEKKDDTPIKWIHHTERYVEKLATPDVSISDLIGDVDPIKAATMKLPYSDERVIHFGLVPRAHRSIFVINELPDLQARIQVSLFNILQEGDLQIRGFKLRMPLDILFIFTANPEDYTNRGSIVTPLKDRIESQILTHYPIDVETAMQITDNEIKLSPEQIKNIEVPSFVKTLLEAISFEARDSEYVDEKSGVSARLSISAMENLVSSAELRMLQNGEKKTSVRISDFWGIVPAMTGKVELVYEGEQEGPFRVSVKIIDAAIKSIFDDIFPNPMKPVRGESDPYGAIKAFFNDGNEFVLINNESGKDFKAKLDSVPGLARLVKSIGLPEADKWLYMEIALHGLVNYDVISKEIVGPFTIFKNEIADLLDDLNEFGTN